MFKIIFTVPIEFSEKVKSAAFGAGAGKQDNYEQCSFEVRGTGQFKPLANSNPFIGNTNELSTVEEIKVEMICDEIHIANALQAIRKAHPYESPMIDVIELVAFAN